MGLATAQLLAKCGAIISLADLNESALQTAVSSLEDSEKHIYHGIVFRKTETVNAWIEATVKKLGKLDGAVNMAGINTPATPNAEMSDDAWDFTMNVNARGVFASLRAEIKVLSVFERLSEMLMEAY